MSEVLTIVFGDDRADKLAPLTRDRVKAAMPFGGEYRIIDFVLTNCMRSDLRRILVLASGRSHSLYSHLREGWSVFNPALGEYVAPFPTPAHTRRVLAESVPALRASRSQIERSGAEEVVILVGGHVYRMDYAAMLEAHRDAGAALTVATVRGPRAAQSSRPLVEVRRREVQGVQMARVRRHDAQDEQPRAMGAYVIGTRTLLEALERSGDEAEGDFADTLLPGIIEHHRVMAYAFGGEAGRVTRDQYWAELDTIDAYFRANLALLEPDPPVNLYQSDWSVWTGAGPNPPARTTESPSGNEGIFVNSVVSNGTVIVGGAVSRSVLGRRVRVEDSATVERAVLFDDVHIGAGAQVRNCIIDKGAQIAPEDRIGFSPSDDAARFTVTAEGVVVVPRGFKDSMGSDQDGLLMLKR